MNYRFPLFALPLLLPLSAPAGVVISEVLFNEAGSDVTGEWIEIYNNGGEEVSLTGWRIGDEETAGSTSLTEAMMIFPDGAIIKPGEVQIVAARASTFAAQHTFKPNYESGQGEALGDPGVPNLTTDPVWDPDGGVINLSNSNDHVLLLDAGGQQMDRVNWGNGSTPQLDPNAEADGQSWHRIDPRVDTDTASDWALTPLGVLSTPGSVPGPSYFEAKILEGPAGVLLRWPAQPGPVSYRVQMSENLEEWSDEALQLSSTEWYLPSDLPARVFFRVWADREVSP